MHILSFSFLGQFSGAAFVGLFVFRASLVPLSGLQHHQGAGSGYPVFAEPADLGG